MRTPALVAALWLASLTSPASTSAQEESPGLPSLFLFRAEILAGAVPQDGLVRLELPVQVAAACRSDLSDLRILGNDQRVLPFVTDLGPPPGSDVEGRQRIPLSLIEVARERRESGRSLTAASETYRLEIAQERRSEMAAGDWDLIVRVPDAEFVRQVRIDTLHDGAPREVTRGSIFRLDQGSSNDRLVLGRLTSSELFGEWIVRLEGQDERYLEPTFFLERSWPLPPRELDWLELPIVSSSRDGDQTVLELDRPPGATAEWLELAPRERVFSRQVSVLDLRDGEVIGNLGGGTLYALPAPESSEPTESIENRLLRLRRARGDRLRLVVTDGDASPLTAPVVRLGQRRPYLVFPLDTAGREALAGRPIATLFFGGGRVDPPRFGLGALLDRLPSGVEVADFDAARLGEVAENPAYSREPALHWAQRAGATLDGNEFRFVRKITAVPSADGLVRLALEPADLAVLHDDLGDLRLVDGENRQWPYLLHRRATTQEIAVEVTERATEEGRTTYRLTLGEGPVPIEQLHIDSPAPYFDRAFELRMLDPEGSPAGERTLATGQLRRRDGEGTVRLALPGARAECLELEVINGDDAPLELTEVTASVPVVELFFPAPAGDYRLLLGAEGVAAPRYELESVRSLVLAVQAGEATTGALRAHAGYRPGLTFDPRRLLLWVAIVLAVAVLGGLTLRLVRGGPEEG